MARNQTQVCGSHWLGAEAFNNFQMRTTQWKLPASDCGFGSRPTLREPLARKPAAPTSDTIHINGALTSCGLAEAKASSARQTARQAKDFMAVAMAWWLAGWLAS